MSPKKSDISKTSGSGSSAPMNLLETAMATERLQEFQRASKLAGLSKLLGGKGPFTIFAPTDKAFAKMPAAERDALFGDTKALARVLSNHIVRERVKAPTTTTSNTVTSVHGNELNLTRDGEGYHVNAARIVKTRIRASNGVIHAIDTVLVPARVS
jgi:uncharacterized surface protein with fasciclin (FAS1) repeats